MLNILDEHVDVHNGVETPDMKGGGKGLEAFGKSFGGKRGGGGAELLKA